MSQYEALYAIKVMDFERKQAKENKREPLPCDVTRSMINSSRTEKYVQEVPTAVMDLVFPSRRLAADALGVQPRRLRHLLSNQATELEKKLLAEKLARYKGTLK